MSDIKLIEPDYLFEVSWEVCNKVGGIHTVVSTKAKTIVSELKDNYILIGPDVWKETHQNPEFIEDTYLFKQWREVAAEEGNHIKIGRWKITGSPIVILVDFTPYFSVKDKIFSEFWEKYQLDSLLGQWDYVEPALFGYAAAKVIESFYEFNLSRTDKIIAQFHEWMTGTGVLYLKDRVPQAGLVFTTHATAIGRTICGNGLPLYKDLDSYNPDSIAKNFNITAKFSLEKISAQQSDCFTTVSDITAKECTQFLGRHVDTVTPNGFEDTFVPDAKSFDEKRQQARELIIKVTSALLNQKIDNDTIFVVNSGRYEFKNKGIDLFIDALGKLNKDTNLNKNVLAFITVPASHSGPKNDIVSRFNNPDFTNPVSEHYLTHWLNEINHDPVLKRIKQNNLNNSPEDKVKIIFVPCYLDGFDGIFNCSYYDLLVGFDLSVFPSYYEPWGYTPLESLAFHIPTITTTLAGFGLWVKQKYGDAKNGIAVIDRNDDNNDSVVNDVCSFILQFSNKNIEEIEQCRQKAFYISRTSLWENLFNFYKKAYSIALNKVENRSDLFKSKIYKEHIEHTLPKQNKPDWKKVFFSAEVPKSLFKLKELANNLWWSWNNEAEELFESIDIQLWNKLNNPVSFLQALPLDMLNELENNEEFIKKLNIIYDKFYKYINRAKNSTEPLIAYFCMEYGLHNSLKTFSGGLGILAGDYLKEASDSNKNIIGVGLLYRYGYFNQSVSLIGDQISDYLPQKYSQLPLFPVRDSNNNWLKIGLALPGRTLYAKVWKVQVGLTPLYLLDTDIEDNIPSDRYVTHHLYGGDLENRFKQELLLGVGGIRLLAELNIHPDLYHCNEGHAAFTGLERLRKYIHEHKISFIEAIELVRASSLFTTHTPVPAGHDAFPEDLIRTYIPHYADRLNISWENFMNLGRMYENNPKEKFSMSVLASKLSQEINAVSRIHCTVTRDMFNPLWENYFPQELFINYVTNGVHYPTWANKRWQKLFKQEFDKDFLSNLSDARQWKKIYKVADESIWKIRKSLKKELFDHVKVLVNDNYTKRNENPKMIFKTIEAINENALTIGFARRFATYKRAHLLFYNLERLEKMLNNKEKPVQLIFAGKAHPQDKAGQDFIKHIIEISKKPEFIGKILFIENYDIVLAKKLVQGVDIWLNTPSRLKEASGTSGQKAAMNGVLNFSVLDGWWAEGYVPDAGWALKEETTYSDDIFQNELDAEIIYNLLQDEIIPLYYKHENDLPVDWIKCIKNNFADISPHYTTKRMIDEYYSKFYNKLFQRSVQLNENNYAKAECVSKWKKRILRSWESIEIVSINIPDSTKEPLKLGEDFKAEIILDLNELTPEDICVEVVFGQKVHDIINEYLFIEDMNLVEINKKHVKFQCTIPAIKAGVYDFTFRIYPKNELLPHRQDFNLVKWI